MSPDHAEGQGLALPSYEKPPVIEVVCGVHFRPLGGLTIPFFGAFWQTIREQYPSTEEKPPLPPFIERLDPAASPPISMGDLSLEAFALPRVFFIDSSKSWVLQLQKDRFVHNWRKVDEESVYPRFPEVSERFFAAWRHFTEFCSEQKLGEIESLQLELTYINHIPLGEGWEKPSQIGNVLTEVSWRPDHSFLPEPESMGWNASFLLPDRQGRLHVQLRLGIRQKDKQTVLLCELTARGIQKGEALEPWFQMAREWIVRGFADLTSEHVQQAYWRRNA